MYLSPCQGVSQGPIPLKSGNGTITSLLSQVEGTFNCYVVVFLSHTNNISFITCSLHPRAVSLLLETKLEKVDMNWFRSSTLLLCLTLFI